VNVIHEQETSPVLMARGRAHESPWGGGRVKLKVRAFWRKTVKVSSWELDKIG